VSTDGGRSWEQAVLEEPVSPAAWQGWSYEWAAARPGSYELCCRAQDAAGNAQPLAPPWNLGGYANNAPQRIAVLVTG
jgi:hypothetical protein